ncbi:S-layer homology domain-containing protein [Flavonifractor sp. AGMB03687]|uniref:S-layer homology domain-containing protein n=1 Tax=Flavonifractor sp. AGMB03687 TaxID=2785133 RepID=UPI001ADFEC4C|nr:S-layer homology domain-containing protein [Flavonifractor sp. AGMB03687]
MKWMRKSLTRLLSAGTCLALVAGMLPGALAARPNMNYEVRADEILKIEDDTFNDYCSDETGYGMSDIRFTDLPVYREGTLYYEYNSRGDQEQVCEGRAIDYNDFYQLVFEPNEDFEGTVYIPFEGESDRGTFFSRSYSGTIKVTVTAARGSSSSDGLLTYEINVNKTLDLSRADFDDYVYEKLPSGTKIESIKFTDLPSSSRGTLYCDYGTRNEEEAGENVRYYADAINSLTFVPARNYEGTVTLPFSGKSNESESFTGEMVIYVGKSASAEGDVTYDVDKNDTVTLNWKDFDAYTIDAVRDSIAQIQFTSLPSSGKGVFYYDYDGRNQAKVDERMYSYDEINDITFVPARNYEGSVRVPFTGKTDNRKSFSGDLVIRVGDAASGDVTIELQASSGGSVTFQSGTFNNACSKETGSNLSYVSFDFTSSSRNGYLYYKYNQSGQSTVGRENYYRSSTPSLDDVTFVPGSSTSDTVTIPFSGKATNGRSFDGQVKITFSELEEPNVILYTTNGKAVDFSAVDFVTACAARGGQLLMSVRFLSPTTDGGQLYYGYESPAKYQSKVNAALQYSLVGNYQLSEVSFVPKAGYTGLVSIPYLGTDAAGITFSGTVNVMVSAPTTSRFSDMSGYSWAIPAVEFLAEYGITTGSGTGSTYSPLSKMTRGDYILMLCRSFGFTSTQTSSFSDVPTNSYYASALAAAKTLGIATADSSGKFYPTQAVTREDAMVFLYRALKAANRGVADASDVVLARFPDSASVSASARTAVATMVQAGVIQGNGQGQLNPKGTLTRAEMATILYRGVTL